MVLITIELGIITATDVVVIMMVVKIKHKRDEQW